MATKAPGWQTDELAEEWVEEEHNDASLGPAQQQESLFNDPKQNSLASTCAVGTVVVRADSVVESTSKDGRLPLAHRLGLVQKNMFSPLKLETMFNPPTVRGSQIPSSPPAFKLDDEVPPTQQHKAPKVFPFDDRKSNLHYPFTFCQPPANTLTPLPLQEGNSRLRLFQFQYDTYTRDHLSAIIDTIPVDNHSSRTRSSDNSHDAETDRSPAFRAPKRIKLSPPDKESSLQVRFRPKRHSTPARRKDHVFASQSLMGAIHEIETHSDASAINPRSAASSTVNVSERSGSMDVGGLVVKMGQVTISNTNIESQKQSLFVAASNILNQESIDTTPLSTDHPPSQMPRKRLQSPGLYGQNRQPFSSGRPSGNQLGTSRISSIASGVKHAGQAISRKTITRIAPSDISPVPEQVGRMQFDRTELRWIKRAGEESDDPFRDIESIKEVNSANLQASYREKSHDGLTISFESPQHVIDLMTGTEGSDDEEVMDPIPPEPSLEVAAIAEQQDATNDFRKIQVTPAATPLTNRLASKTIPTPIRSALKGRGNTVTPVSARLLQTGSSDNRAPHPRSVSFSDGRRSGRIRGLHAEGPEEESSRSKDSVPQLEERQSYQPSLRTKRIADMLDDLDETSRDEEDATPCKVSSRQRSMVGSLLSNSSATGQSRVASLLMPERSGRGIDATFLTECSFGVAHDRLLQCITDVQPFEPHWEELTSVNLTGKRLDSLARLKEFMPKLEDLIIDENVVSWLSGIPKGLRTLSAVSNQLTGLTSYVHLPQLETLDISNNQVDSLLQLECLHRLRELRADHNEIHSLAGLYKLRKLRKLSLVGNYLTQAALREQEWHELEYLDLSENKLSSVEGLEALENVTFVNLDRNEIQRLDIAGPMHRLRCFRVSDNKLEGPLDVRWLGNVRILHADRNRLTGMVHGEKLRRLETLSLRYQSGRGLVVKAKDVRDVRRLYLSGNSLGNWFLDEPCYNLIYLELAHCELTRIPGDLGRVVPNLRVLNLNYNFIADVEPVASLGRLRKLSMIGSRVKGTKAIIRAVGRLRELEMVDFRMNPCTVSWYVPVLDRSDGDWQELDAKFRRGLPDELYASRLVYRGQLIRSCERLKMVDGLRVSEGERTKTLELLRRIEGEGRRSGD